MSMPSRSNPDLATATDPDMARASYDLATAPDDMAMGPSCLPLNATCVHDSDCCIPHCDLNLFNGTYFCALF